MEDFTQQFIQDCLKTESNDFDAIRKRINETAWIRDALKEELENFFYLAKTLDTVKKGIFYGKGLDEYGDYEFEGFRIDKLSDKNIRLLHAGLGLATEAAEFLEQLYKHLFEGQELDEVNLLEELGDGSGWYTAIGLDALGESSYKPTFDRIIAKLKARYGEKFSSNAAINRNLEKEREVLEASQ